MMSPRASRHRLVVVLLAIYLVSAALVAFWPTPVDRSLGPKLARLIEKLHNHGVPAWLDYDQVQFGANILFFVPLTFLLTLLLRRRLWGFVVVVGLVISIGIELAQGQFLTERFSSVSDVTANAIGSFIGSVLACLLRKPKKVRLPAEGL